MVCPATLTYIITRYYNELATLTNRELDALAHMCTQMKEEEE